MGLRMKLAFVAEQSSLSYNSICFLKSKLEGIHFENEWLCEVHVGRQAEIAKVSSSNTIES